MYNTLYIKYSNDILYGVSFSSIGITASAEAHTQHVQHVALPHSGNVLHCIQEKYYEYENVCNDCGNSYQCPTLGCFLLAVSILVINHKYIAILIWICKKKIPHTGDIESLNRCG